MSGLGDVAMLMCNGGLSESLRYEDLRKLCPYHGSKYEPEQCVICEAYAHVEAKNER